MSIAREIERVSFENELKQSYLEYAMSVIVGRALPDVRDGLKPVHRRVLYAMHELNNEWNKPYKKSARVVGDVIGKYHPHGESAIYDTIVRMAQPFSLRYMLVDGQGNFGSVDGDAPAAMRYTEVRLSKIAHELLVDLDKETVDFVPNYDETEKAPAVLPARAPNLLVNGSSGIAVGMATNIPPHNLGEIIDACIALIENPELEARDLLRLVPGPDFPTAGIIHGRRGIEEAYCTGRARIVIRGRTHFETDAKSGKERIIVTELPYQVNKARLIENVAELVREKKIEGISGLRDESDKQGMRIVIELRRGESNEVILNHLLSHTQLQIVYGIIMLALENGQPKVMTLKEMLAAFIRHRREVVTRRTLFELRKARDRAHTLEGLAIALANIDAMIALIKQAKDPENARKALCEQNWKAGQVLPLLLRARESDSDMKGDQTVHALESGYKLSAEQAQSILDMRLHRLTGLEQEKIINEYQNLIDQIRELMRIVNDSTRLMQVIREELVAIKEEFGDARRTEIIEQEAEFSYEDLVPEEDMVITLSHTGYVKTQPVQLYQAQHRGGKGKAATQVKEEDYVDIVTIAHSHDTLLCFSSQGKVYWLKTYQIPQASRISKGKPIVNILPLSEGETINAILPVNGFEAEQFVFLATSRGVVKKVSLVHFSRPRSQGIIALDLAEDDKLIGAHLTHGDHDLLLFTNVGRVIRFSELKVRPMGRSARGVTGIKLEKDQKVIALVAIGPDSGGAILTATKHGFGKRTALTEYPVKGRGGKGVISIQVSERNGDVVAALQVLDEDEVILISDKGTLVRVPVAEISVVGRNTQGVKLVQLNEAEALIAVERVPLVVGGENIDGNAGETGGASEEAAP